jgi:uncharacterized cupin superfamily protein
MSNNGPYVLNFADVKLDWTSHHGDVFDAKLGGIGSRLGFKKLGSMLHVVPPGKRAFPVHRHHGVDEMFIVLAGTGEYRVDGEAFPIRPGDVLAAPAGGPVHQIVNTGDQELRYVGISNIVDCDVIEYPDSDKVYAMAGARAGDPSCATYCARGRLTAADYWDGEEG